MYVRQGQMTFQNTRNLLHIVGMLGLQVMHSSSLLPSFPLILDEHEDPSMIRIRGGKGPRSNQEHCRHCVSAKSVVLSIPRSFPKYQSSEISEFL